MNGRVQSPAVPRGRALDQALANQFCLQERPGYCEHVMVPFDDLKGKLDCWRMAMTDLRICFVGDSFVNGTGDDEVLGWAGRVCRTARGRGVPLTRYDLGVRRDTSTLILRRCTAEVAARLDGVPCDGRVVFSFGANDAAHDAGRPRVEPAAMLTNACALLGWAGARYPTLIVGPPPIADDPAHDARVAALSAALGRLCAELEVPFLDLHGPLSGDAIWRAEALAGDGVHPNAGGYTRAAALVEAWAPWRAWTS